MANITSNVLVICGDEQEVSRFHADITVSGSAPPEYDLNALVPLGSEDPLTAWGATTGSFDVTIPEPDRLPREVCFESRSVPPIEQVRRISAKYPTLVFGLRFLDEMLCYVGWAVFHSGTLYNGKFNSDVWRHGDRDRETCEREALSPEAATIDGYEATEWAQRYSDAINAVPTPDEIKDADPSIVALAAEFHAMADRVEDLAGEYRSVSTPLGKNRVCLEGFCEEASFNEAVFWSRYLPQRLYESEMQQRASRGLGTSYRDGLAHVRADRLFPDGDEQAEARDE